MDTTEFNNKLGELITEASVTIPRAQIIGALEGAKFYILYSHTQGK